MWKSCVSYTWCRWSESNRHALRHTMAPVRQSLGVGGSRACYVQMVAEERLELSCLAAHDFESCVSAIPPLGPHLNIMNLRGNFLTSLAELGLKFPLRMKQFILNATTA